MIMKKHYESTVKGGGNFVLRSFGWDPQHLDRERFCQQHCPGLWRSRRSRRQR